MAKFKTAKEIEEKIKELERQILELKQLQKITSAPAHKAENPFENVMAEKPKTTQVKTTFKTSSKPQESQPIGIDLNAIKEQLKAEIKSELRQEYEQKIQAARLEGLKEGRREVKQLRESAKKQGVQWLRATPPKRAGRPAGPKRLTGAKREKFLEKLFTEGKITEKAFMSGRIPSKYLPKRYKRGADKWGKVINQRFSAAEKEAALERHHLKAKQAGKSSVKPLPTGLEAKLIEQKMLQDLKRTCEQKGYDFNKIKLGNYKGARIQQLAKLMSYVRNPSGEQGARAEIWKQVLRGEIPLFSKELWGRVIQTRDSVGDYAGVNTP